MTDEEFDNKIKDVRKELDKITFPKSVSRKSLLIKEQIFEHKSGNYKISIKCCDNIVYIRLIRIRKNLKYNYYESINIKRAKLEIKQKAEIIQIVRTYKKELELRNMF
jgi:hypothetical protein